MYFIKLAILVFGCPRDRYITNFTRKPLLQKPVGELLLPRLQGGNALLLLLLQGLLRVACLLRLGLAGLGAQAKDKQEKEGSHNWSALR